MNHLAANSVLVVSFLAAACSNTSGDTATDGDLHRPSPGDGHQFSIDRAVAAGEEVVVCREFTLDEPMTVDRVEHAFGAGAHHLLVYRMAERVSAPGETFDCGEIPGPLVYIANVGRDEVRFPEGVGLELEAGETIRVELHYPNASDETIVAAAAANLWRAKAPITHEAGGFFFYHRDIVLAPRAETRVKLRCEIPTDIQILSLTPHTHLLGSRLEVRVLDDANEPRTILDVGTWTEQLRHTFAEPERVRASETIEVECTFSNPGATAVIEGPSKNGNEMCLLLGEYYPRMPPAAEWCTLEGSGPVQNGTLTCREALTCSNATDDPIAAEQCFVDVCAESSRALNDVTNCGFNECNVECVFGGPDCVPCVAEKCPEALARCGAAECRTANR